MTRSDWAEQVARIDRLLRDAAASEHRRLRAIGCANPADLAGLHDDLTGVVPAPWQRSDQKRCRDIVRHSIHALGHISQARSALLSMPAGDLGVVMAIESAFNAGLLLSSRALDAPLGAKVQTKNTEAARKPRERPDSDESVRVKELIANNRTLGNSDLARRLIGHGANLKELDKARARIKRARRKLDA